MNTTKESHMISHERKEEMISYQGKRRGEREEHITSREGKGKI
jgi:hypothetical protein